VATALGKSDPKAHSFAVLLPKLLGGPNAKGNARD